MNLKNFFPIIVWMIFCCLAESTKAQSHSREKRNIVIEWFHYLSDTFASRDTNENVKHPPPQQQQQQQQQELIDNILSAVQNEEQERDVRKILIFKNCLRCHFVFLSPLSFVNVWGVWLCVRVCLWGLWMCNVCVYVCVRVWVCV